MITAFTRQRIFHMEPVGVEPTTFARPVRCSPIELRPQSQRWLPSLTMTLATLRMEWGSNPQGFRSPGFKSSAVANPRLVHPNILILQHETPVFDIPLWAGVACAVIFCLMRPTFTLLRTSDICDPVCLGVPTNDAIRMTSGSMFCPSEYCSLHSGRHGNRTRNP